jgi:UDP-N-acetylmuramoylalanine-D-glutamate ligase
MHDDTRFGGPWVEALGLPGQHNARNASMARAVLFAMGVEEGRRRHVDGRRGRGVRRTAQPLPLIGHVGPVEFVDDSLSTNVLPAQAALEAYADRPVALLVGGHDRGLDYSPLGVAVARRTSPTLVVTMPDNGPRIGHAIRLDVGDRVEVVDAADLREAVATAFDWARGAAWSCSHRPLRASGVSPTTASGPAPSPKPRPNAVP